MRNGKHLHRHRSVNTGNTRLRIHHGEVMADRGKSIDEATLARIRRLSAEGWSKTKIAREARVSRPTAYKYAADKTSKKSLE